MLTIVFLLWIKSNFVQFILSDNFNHYDLLLNCIKAYHFVYFYIFLKEKQMELNQEIPTLSVGCWSPARCSCSWPVKETGRFPLSCDADWQLHYLSELFLWVLAFKQCTCIAANCGNERAMSHSSKFCVLCVLSGKEVGRGRWPQQ